MACRLIHSLLLSLVCVGSAQAATFNLFSPANGVLKGSSTTYVTSQAASTDIIGLWSGTCNSGTFLRGDGSCQVASIANPQFDTVRIGTGLITTPATGGLTASAAGTFGSPTWNFTTTSNTGGNEPGMIIAGNSSGAGLSLYDTSAGAGLGKVRMRYTSQQFVIGECSDTFSGCGNFLFANLGSSQNWSQVTLVAPVLHFGFLGNAVASTAYGDFSIVSSANANRMALLGNGASGTFNEDAFVFNDSTSSNAATFTVNGQSIFNTALFTSGTLGVARGGTGAATLTGVLKGNGTSAFTAATSSDVIALWSGTCNNTTFLRGDGSCAASGGAGSSFGDNWNWSTTPSTLQFTFPSSAGNWLALQDNTGGDTTVVINAGSDVNVSANDIVNISATVSVNVSSDDVSVFGTGNVSVEGDGSLSLISDGGTIGLTSNMGNIAMTGSAVGSSISIDADTIQFGDHTSGNTAAVAVGGTLKVNTINVCLQDGTNCPSVTAQTTGNFTMTLATGCTTTPTGTAYWTKTGNVVTLQWPTFSCTDNSSGGGSFSGLPAGIRPTGRGSGLSAVAGILAVDAGTFHAAAASVCPTSGGCTAGTMVIAPIGGLFSGAGTIVITGQTITYALD